MLPKSEIMNLLQDVEEEWVLTNRGRIVSKLPKRKIIFLVLTTMFFSLLSHSSTSHSSPSRSIPHPLIPTLSTHLTQTLNLTISLLMSYRTNQALSKWTRGKALWVALREECAGVRRMMGVWFPERNASSSSSSSPTSSSSSSSPAPSSSPNPTSPTPNPSPDPLAYLTTRPQIQRRTDDLAGDLCLLFHAFVFALHYHLTSTKPVLWRSPLLDLLPAGYQGESPGRVRFDDELDPSSPTHKTMSTTTSTSTAGHARGETTATGRLRRRSTGTRLREKEKAIQESQVNVDLDGEFGEGFEGEQGVDGDGELGMAFEMTPTTSTSTPTTSTSTPTTSTSTSSSTTRTKRSNFSSRNVSGEKLVHDILRLIELHIHNLHLSFLTDQQRCSLLPPPLRPLPSDGIGLTASQSEKLYAAARGMRDHLILSETISKDPPPLALSRHMGHILTLYLLTLSIQTIPTLGLWSAVVSLIASWALLGLEALCREAGLVFGKEEGCVRTRTIAMDTLAGGIEAGGLFTRAYRGKLEARLCRSEARGTGTGTGTKRDEGEWMVLDRLRGKREGWTPDFELPLGRA